MTRRSQPRGFTLIELLVTMAVSMTVVAGISMTFIAQAKTYQTQATRRSSQANSRQGIGFMIKQLRQVGYGTDPDKALLAFDSFNAASSMPGTNYPDGITVYTRDPIFNRQLVIANSNSSQLKLTTALTEPLLKGQVLLILCPNASLSSYVTVRNKALAGAVDVFLEPAASGPPPPYDELPTTGPGIFFHDSYPPCPDTVRQPMVVKIDRASFYVASFDDDGDVTTPERTPFLMYHTGRDENGDGSINASDATPIAMGVEQMQIAYMMTTTREKVMPTIMGVTGTSSDWFGVNWRNSGVYTGPKSPDSTNEKGWMAAPYDDLSRTTSYPANVRQVRISLVTRGTNTTQGETGDDMNDTSKSWNVGTAADGTVLWRAMENLGSPTPADFTPSGGGYLRTVQRFSVTTRNLQMRSQHFPPNSSEVSGVDVYVGG
jgi:type IV pilus assembly protein PilW